MSRPRAATSVATITRASPDLKASSALSRCASAATPRLSLAHAGVGPEQRDRRARRPPIYPPHTLTHTRAAPLRDRGGAQGEETPLPAAGTITERDQRTARGRGEGRLPGTCDCERSPWISTLCTPAESESSTKSDQCGRVMRWSRPAGGAWRGRPRLGALGAQPARPAHHRCGPSSSHTVQRGDRGQSRSAAERRGQGRSALPPPRPRPPAPLPLHARVHARAPCCVAQSHRRCRRPGRPS